MSITFEKLPIAVTLIQEELASIKTLLLERGRETIKDEDQLLTIQQVGQLLSLSIPTIYGLVSRSKIPCMKKGKRLYFSKDEVTSWVKEGRKLTNEDRSNEVDSFLSNQKKKGAK